MRLWRKGWWRRGGGGNELKENKHQGPGVGGDEETPTGGGGSPPAPDNAPRTQGSSHIAELSQSLNNSLDSKPNIPYDNDTATLDVLEEMGRLGTVDKVEDLRDCIGEPITNKEEDIKQGRKLHKSNHSMRMNEMRGKMFIFSRFSF